MINEAGTLVTYLTEESAGEDTVKFVADAFTCDSLQHASVDKTLIQKCLCLSRDDNNSFPCCGRWILVQQKGPKLQSSGHRDIEVENHEPAAVLFISMDSTMPRKGNVRL